MTEEPQGPETPIDGYKVDDPLVELLVKHGFAEAIRFDHGRKRWLYFKSPRWRVDLTRHVYDEVRKKANSMWVSSPGATEREQILSLYSLARKEAVLKSLSARDEVAMRGDEWDQDGYMLGFNNGIVDLRDGSFDPNPGPDVLVSKTVRTNWDPEAECPIFTQFLRDIMGNDQSLVEYLWGLLGYSLFGTQAEQKFWMWVGRGANGKGILARTMLRVLGDYAERPSDELYMRNKFGASSSSAPRPDLVRLMGSRFIYVSEPQGGQFNEELLKAHTGDDPILARDLYGKAGEMLVFPPTHKIIVLTNDMPKTDDVGVSMKRRVRVIRFEQDYSPESGRADFGLEARIEAEKPGILRALVQAATIWWNDGDPYLPEPGKVVEWSREYIEENDPLSPWIEASCNLGPHERAQSALLYGSYQDWCARNGLEARSQMWLSSQLLKRYRKERASAGVVFYGIGLKSAVEAAAEDEDDE